MSRKPTTDNKLNSIDKENLAPTFTLATPTAPYGSQAEGP